MSAEGNQNTNAVELEKSVAELQARYAKKEKVVCLANDDQEAFIGFASKIGEANYKDWSQELDTDTFNGFAMVLTDETKVNRLIGIASEDAVFADPIARKALYKMYVNRVVNAAAEPDATPDRFVIVSGCFKQKFDIEAFKFQAKAFVHLLREQNVTGINNKSLQMAFASDAFARTQFPRVAPENWEMLLGIAKKNAENRGFDTSIFDHWTATRAVKTADVSILKLDFSALEAEENVEEDEAEPVQEAAKS